MQSALTNHSPFIQCLEALLWAPSSDKANVYINIQMYTYRHVYKYIHIYIYIYTCIYIYIYMKPARGPQTISFWQPAMSNPGPVILAGLSGGTRGCWCYVGLLVTGDPFRVTCHRLRFVMYSRVLLCITSNPGIQAIGS